MVGLTRPRAVYSLTNATPARTIWVYRNGDSYYLGRKFVINHRYVPNFEAFMIQLNEGVPTPFGVRNIYTPRQGHSVMDLPDLEQGGRYVVAGREKFRKLNYYNIGAKKPQRKKRDDVIRPVVHSNIKVPSKWQCLYNKPRNINVFTNGDMLIPPVRILIPKFTLKSWNAVLGVINEKVFPRSGGVQRLYTLNGQLVKGPGDLEDNQFYVGSSKEKFQPLLYWQHPKVPGDIRWFFSSSPEPTEKPPPKKTPIIEPSKQEGSTYHPVEPSKRGAGDRASVYYAKPEKAKPEKAKPEKASGETAPTPLSSTDGHSVYKAQNSPTEIEGAREVQDDQHVQVEMPVDQAPAEVVQEEDIYSSVGSPEAQAKIEEVEESAEMEKPVKKGIFNSMFGFMFSKSKKKDESDVGALGFRARTDSNTSNVDSVTPPLLPSHQDISTGTDDKETKGTMGSIGSLEKKGNDALPYLAPEKQIEGSGQPEDHVDSANLPQLELMQNTVGDLEVIWDDTKEDGIKEQDEKKQKQYYNPYDYD